MNTVTLFNLYLCYKDEEMMRPIATGCNKEQLLDALSRHAYLSEVDLFIIYPMDKYEPFKEYSL